MGDENQVNSPSRLPAPRTRVQPSFPAINGDKRPRIESNSTAGKMVRVRAPITTTARPTAPLLKRPAPKLPGYMAPVPVRQDPDLSAIREELSTVREHLKRQENQMGNHQAVERLVEVEAQKRMLETTLQAKDEECQRMLRELTMMKMQLETEQAARAEEASKLKGQLEEELAQVTRQRNEYKREVNALESRFEEMQTENGSLKLTISRNAATILDLESQIQALKAKQEAMQGAILEREGVAACLNEKLIKAVAQISDLESKLQEGERIRRSLHNAVQELKGNIRVFCRIRPTDEPLSAMEWGRRTEEDQEELVMKQQGESANGGAIVKTFPFAFDRVFGPASSQSEVFAEISQLVQSALDGYRVCIFAYGQTGSGKTHTMEGNPEHPGMIPRAVEQIFTQAAMLAPKGWQFALEASYLEIYNETIRDLLGNNESLSHEIRHQNGKTTVTDLTIQSVSTEEQIMQLLQMAGKNRAVGETLCNDRSSRSHSVFTLSIRGENGVTGEKIEGLLNLIDLAGSERLSQSGATGDRLKETQAINKSLSSLGDVIQALANRDAHIPYRNSKLTYLLQNSLGGNSKTLMFVNVTPNQTNFQETLCSLRFATKVNSCQIGTARKNVK